MKKTMYLTSVLDKEGRRFKGRLILSELVSNEARKDINAAVGRRSVAGMRQIHMHFKDVKDSLDNEAFSQKDFFHERHEIIFHIPPYACD